MNLEDEEFTPYGAFSSGCDIHGEDFLRECTMCGIEFCAACFPQSRLCSDCSAQGSFDDEDDEPTDEEKDLRLVDEFNDDEHIPETDEPLAAPPPAPVKKATPARKAKKKPAPAASKAKGKAKAKPVAKTKKPVSKAKAKAKPKSKTKKPAKPAPKKRKR